MCVGREQCRAWLSHFHLSTWALHPAQTWRDARSRSFIPMSFYKHVSQVPRAWELVFINKWNAIIHHYIHADHARTVCHTRVCIVLCVLRPRARLARAMPAPRSLAPAVARDRIWGARARTSGTRFRSVSPSIRSHVTQKPHHVVATRGHEQPSQSPQSPQPSRLPESPQGDHPTVGRQAGPRCSGDDAAGGTAR